MTLYDLYYIRSFLRMYRRTTEFDLLSDMRKRTYLKVYNDVTDELAARKSETDMFKEI